MDGTLLVHDGGGGGRCQWFVHRTSSGHCVQRCHRLLVCLKVTRCMHYLDGLCAIGGAIQAVSPAIKCQATLCAAAQALRPPGSALAAPAADGNLLLQGTAEAPCTEASRQCIQHHCCCRLRSHDLQIQSTVCTLSIEMLRGRMLCANFVYTR